MKRTFIKEVFEDSSMVKGHMLGYRADDPNLQIINELKPDKKVLSLGCGSGREVRELLKRGHEVVGVDFSKNMISASKKIAPKTKYYCLDAVKFAEENKDKMKFDYILGLFSYLGYIENEKRQQHVNNLMSMLSRNGELILEVRRVTQSPKYFLKCFIAPFFAFYFGDSWKFGDVYGRNAKNIKAGWHKSHHFTKRELKKLFNSYDIKINKSKVHVQYKDNLS